MLEVNSADATLEAVINPEGEATTYQIEYGPTTAYGSTTPPQPVGELEQPYNVSAFISGLTPSTTYHWRVIAINSVTVTGSDGIFTTQALPGHGDESCPNQSARLGAARRLPDCRGYEMVSPVDKGGSNIEPGLTINSYFANLDQASSSGDALTYTTLQGFAGSAGAPYARQYLARRTSAGWANTSIAAPQNISKIPGAEKLDLEYLSFTPDLCVGGLLNFSEPALAPQGVDDAPNLYLHRQCGTGGALSAVTITPHQVRPELGWLSPDGSCAVYFSNQFILNEFRASGGDDPGGVWENCEGVSRRLDVLPDGTPTEGRSAPGGAGSAPEQSLHDSTLANAVSKDGSIVYWHDLGSEDPGRGQIFVRVNAKAEESAHGASGECLEPAKACTLPVSALIGSGPSGMEFAGASADGMRAFFYPSSTNVLYEYNLPNRTVREVAPNLATFGEGNQPLRPLVGVSDDGSRLYFVSTGEIAGEGTSGMLNLFLAESTSPPAQSTHLVASLALTENARFSDYSLAGTPAVHIARVSPDGSHLVFATPTPLSAYDNRALGSGARATEVYEYNADGAGGTGVLTCISCNPTGERPEARKLEVPPEPTRNEYAATIPGYYTSLQGARVMTDDGSRVFFESFDALVAQDTNGQGDVYEWTREGTNGCSRQSEGFAEIDSGCLALISSGQSADNSRLIDVTADGHDVFFATSQSLVPQDPGLIDIYDAREGGGFAPPPSPAPGCEGEACQGPLAPPSDPTPGSATYHGPGNIAKAKGRKRKKKRKARGHTNRNHHRSGNRAGGSK